MTTPNYDTAGTGGYKSSTDSANDSGMNNSGSSGSMGSGSTGTDDVSFGRSTGGRAGQGSSMDSAKDTMKRGITSAEDAMGQLQQKASDMTSRLIDNIDVDDLTQKLEQQVREHPARTLAVAIGAGFLLGRAAKK
ncbi:MAG: hypothetical protein ACR2M1_17145 [Gemmatimonadaceae bacterium]